MIEITNEQIERVNLLLSGVPNGAEKAMKSVIQRANSTIRTETLKGITSVYAISKQNVRAETTIVTKIEQKNGGIVGTVSFAGYQIPLYRFDVSPKLPGQHTIVKARVMKGNAKTPFMHAFIAKTQIGHIGTDHTGVFERKRKTRLPIGEITGLSTAQMAKNTIVLEQIEEKTQGVINKRIEHEISRILNGYGG